MHSAVWPTQQVYGSVAKGYHVLCCLLVAVFACVFMLEIFLLGCAVLLPNELLWMQCVLELLALANRFDLSSLQVSVCDYLIGNLTVTNVCSTLDMAIFFQLERLRKSCLCFIDQNAMTVLKDESFLQLSQKALTQLLQRDSFFAPESDIFAGAAAWCHTNMEEYETSAESPTDSKDTSTSGCVVDSSCHKEVFASVLSHVRLSLMPVEDIFGTVRQSNLFTDTCLLNSMEERIMKPEAENARHRGKLSKSIG